MADGFQFSHQSDQPLNSGATESDRDLDWDKLGLEDGAPVDDDDAPQGMSEEDFRGAFHAAIEDAEDYIDSFIAPQRAKATNYYHGLPFGNEEEGRSKVVSTEVRDSVHSITPSLLRTFTGGEHAVEFVPQNPQSVEIARQQTDYTSYVFQNDNRGFDLLETFFLDGLIRKTGVLKWRWSEDLNLTEERYTGLFAEQVTIIQQDPSAEIIELTERIEQSHTSGPLPAGTQPEATPVPRPMFDVRIRRHIPEKRCVVECLPVEEWLIDRDARNANDIRGWRFQAHRSIKTVSEIVAMGYPKEVVEEHASFSDSFANTNTNSPDESQERLKFVEAYMWIDADLDGIAELHKIHSIGNAHFILSDEIVDDFPFAVFSPIPEPHSAIGMSVADLVMDLQLIKSNIMRAIMDSAAQSIHPRTVVLRGQADLDSVMNTEQGAIAVEYQAGAVRELSKPFLGTQVMPIVAYLDDLKSKRTGLTDAMQGLNPEMLQSATQDAVMATITGGQERIEMIARNAAEALRRLFRGMAKTLRENQDAPRLVKLRGSFIAVDPRSWVGELECVANVLMGRGTDQQRLGFLTTVLAQQKEILAQLGPVNPICGVDRIVNTMHEILTLAGFKDPTKYIGDTTPDFMQQLQQQAANKPPQAADVLAQAEMQKVQSAAQYQQARLQQEQQQMMLNHQRDMLKIYVDAVSRLENTDAQFGINPAHQALIDARLQHEQALAGIQADYAAAIHRNNTQAQAQVQSAAMKAVQPQQPGLPPQGPAQ